MAGHKKSKDNKGPQERDYPGYNAMKTLFRLAEEVVQPQMRALEGLGLKKPVAVRGALSASATGHNTQGSDFYYVADLPEEGMNGIRLPGARVEPAVGKAVRITFNDSAGHNIEVLAVPSASRLGVDAMLRNEPGAFGVAVDTQGIVHCTEAFKTTAALNPATGRTASLPTLRQGRLGVRAVCAAM